MIRILLILLPITSLAQGFEWHGTGRLPEKFPIFFAGVNSNVEFSLHEGEFDFIEANTVCCPYSNANGLGFNAQLSADYWYSNDITLTVAIGYRLAPVIFSSETSIPIAPGEEWLTEFSSDIGLHYLFVDFGFKYNLISQFYIGLSLNPSILIFNSQEHKEKSLNPDIPFANGEYETEIPGSIPELNSISLGILFSVGYNIVISRGLYISPQINYGMPLTAIAKDSDWMRDSFSFGITFYHGINF